MTYSRILDLAYYGALKSWQRENALLKNEPDNKTWKEKESRAWDDLKEIEKLLREDEKHKGQEVI